MSGELLLPSDYNLEKNKIAYKFILTGQNVYTLEEFMFHFYYNWKLCREDILADKFILWVKECLGIERVYLKLKQFKKKYNLSVDVSGLAVSFLEIINYFPADKIKALKDEIITWENRSNWEKAIEQGDFFLWRKNYKQAYDFYKEALNFGENVRVINNIGITLMYEQNYKKAIEYFETAFFHREDRDFNLEVLTLNIVECYMLNGDYAVAFDRLKNLTDEIGESYNAKFMLALINKNSGNYRKAETILGLLFEENRDDFNVVLEMLDIYNIKKDFKAGIKLIDEVLERKKCTDKEVIVLNCKKAEMLEALKNVEQAIYVLEESFKIADINKFDEEKVEILVQISKIYRKNFNLKMAKKSIEQALAIDSENSLVLFEVAMIEKEAGRFRPYKEMLHRILGSFRERFRGDGVC